MQKQQLASHFFARTCKLHFVREESDLRSMHQVQSFCWHSVYQSLYNYYYKVLQDATKAECLVV